MLVFLLVLYKDGGLSHTHTCFGVWGIGIRKHSRAPIVSGKQASKQASPPGLQASLASVSGKHSRAPSVSGKHSRAPIVSGKHSSAPIVSSKHSSVPIASGKHSSVPIASGKHSKHNQQARPAGTSRKHAWGPPWAPIVSGASSPNTTSRNPLCSKRARWEPPTLVAPIGGSRNKSYAVRRGRLFRYTCARG